MAAGIDVAASAAQVISLSFELFQGCINAYKFCHTAQLIGSEGDLLRVKLQIEQYRLQTWADCAKLETGSPHDRLYWPLIHEILQQQQTTLTSAKELKKKYGLDLPEYTGNPAGAIAALEPKTASKLRGLDRILRGLQPKLYTDSNANIIAASNGTLKRLKWAAGGRDKVLKVIDDLGQLNDQLERLLDLPDRNWLKSGIGALLRETLSRSTDKAEVETLQKLLRPSAGVGDAAIVAAAEFKRIRLVLGVDQRPDEIRPEMTAAIYDTMPRLRTFKEKRLSQISQRPGQTLQTAVFEDRNVVVERRVTQENRFASLERHMQGLALLLGNTDSTFASLNCIGLSVSKETCTFGLVYRLPGIPDLAPKEGIELRNLQELISTGRKCSLRDRVRIALTLAEAVLQIHTAGWLHKSIRSDNVVFVGGTRNDPEAFLGGSPYLVGYDYARPESETSLTELPDAPLCTELYRHPDKRGRVATGFKKRFDLFALGCVLGELALWECLVDIISRSSERDWSRIIREAEASKQDLNVPSFLDVANTPAFVRDVHHAAGPKFLDAVKLCLDGAVDGKEEADVSLTIQRRVVELLRECNV